MRAYLKRPREGKPFRLPQFQPDLFEWDLSTQCTDGAALPHPARVIARRFGLAPLRARLVAELAGFNLESNQHG